MKTRTEGFTLVEDLKWRAWNGVIADLWNVSCSPDAQGEYISPNPRLFIALEMEGEGGFLLNEGEGRDPAKPSEFLPMSYVPANMAVRGRAERLSRIRHLDLHFESATLARKFGDELDPVRLQEARIMFHDERLAGLAALIAQECASDRPMSDLYGNGLLDAVMVLLFGVEQKKRRRRSQLSNAQMRRVTAYIEAHCLDDIRLVDLAALTNLSESYFSHAFKATTGVAPHRWHMQVRIGKVKQMLLHSRLPLTEIAAVAGFSDQAHLTRVFKSLVGAPPAAWMRDVGASRCGIAARSAQEDSRDTKNVQSFDEIMR